MFSKICQLAGDDADGNYDGDDNYNGDVNCDFNQDYEWRVYLDNFTECNEN